MNLETNNINFNLVSELFIDKVKEKIKGLDFYGIPNLENLKVKIKKKYHRIQIFIINRDYEKENEEKENEYEGYNEYGEYVECDEFYENEEYDENKEMNDYNNSAIFYDIIIERNFKTHIFEYKTVQVGTDFESVLHNINIISSTFKDILETIKNELSKITIDEDDIKNYIKDINEPITIYKTQDSNSGKILIELKYKNIITYTATFNQGIFEDIKIDVKNQDYNKLDNNIQNTTKALKAFQYYLYNKNTENETYKKKYKRLIDEIYSY